MIKAYEVIFVICRSPYERLQDIIKELLEDGVVYGSDSAGALVAGPAIEWYRIG